MKKINEQKINICLGAEARSGKTSMYYFKD